MFKTLQGCRLTTPIWNTALLCSSLEAPWTRLSSYLPTDGETTSDDHHITLLCADRGPQGLDASVCTLSRSLPQCLLKQNPSCISRQLQATSRRRITVNGREGDSSPQRRCTVSPGNSRAWRLTALRGRMLSRLEARSWTRLGYSHARTRVHNGAPGIRLSWSLKVSWLCLDISCNAIVEQPATAPATPRRNNVTGLQNLAFALPIFRGVVL